MQDQYSRTQLLLGAEAMTKLHDSRVAVFGVGGVGGYTVEALARSGVGALDLIDDDKVCLTNLNRQIIATRKTVGRFKVDVAEERVHDIDPNIKVTTYKTFFGPETQDSFDFSQFDYVVDAIDTVTGKIALVMKCKEAGVPIICSMGAGNKMDPTRFEVTDIYKTSVCPLAKVMRTECRKRRIKHLKVVYSREPVMTPIEDDSISCKNHCICPPGTQRKCTIRRSVPGSNAFVPSVVGLIIGGGGGGGAAGGGGGPPPSGITQTLWKLGLLRNPQTALSATAVARRPIFSIQPPFTPWRILHICAQSASPTAKQPGNMTVVFKMISLWTMA